MGEIRGLRNTFEDVLDNQELMREKLDALIRENRPLKDDDEVKEYIRLVARSMMGVTSHGSGHEIEFKVAKNGIHVLGNNIEKVAYKLGYYKTRTVVVSEEPRVEVEIKELWQLLLEYAFDVWPRAQFEAIKISPEREGGTSHGGVRGIPRGR